MGCRWVGLVDRLQVGEAGSWVAGGWGCWWIVVGHGK